MGSSDKCSKAAFIEKIKEAIATKSEEYATKAATVETPAEKAASEEDPSVDETTGAAEEPPSAEETTAEGGVPAA